MTCVILRFAVAFFFVTGGLRTWAQEVSKDEHIQIGSLSVNRILFLGNSITLHGPAPDIGWTGDWGMAASSQDKDYVHLIVQDIVKATGKTPEIRIRNIAEFERGLSTYVIPEKLKDELQFQPDIVIVAIGENAARPESAEAKKEFSSAFSRLIESLEESGKPTIFVRSQFWPDEIKDGLMKEVTLARKHHWIDLSKLIDESCYARSERKIEHAGVAGHPGDKGMSVIARALFQALNDAGKSELK
ncbi:MAG: SGNH/GDSL hydrolase family protein [Planctomycetaceae bacterium]|nr:SGNH/GDSL hydrolase family protein [Planctomycetaceae bacterium]